MTDNGIAVGVRDPLRHRTKIYESCRVVVNERGVHVPVVAYVDDSGHCSVFYGGWNVGTYKTEAGAIRGAVRRSTRLSEDEREALRVAGWTL